MGQPGTLDPLWAKVSLLGAGKVITPISNDASSVTAAALQLDGKVLLAGNCSDACGAGFCAVRLRRRAIRPSKLQTDIDGDGRRLATTDMLIGTRIALGMTGSAVVNGIIFPATAVRNTWPMIRDYLVTQCGMSLAQ